LAVTVDARGLACPQPVIETRKAMQQGDKITVLVDNETSLTNVSHMAKKAGWEVEIISQGDEYQLHVVKGEDVSLPEAVPVGRAAVLNGPLVLVVSSESMGRGQAELGSILMRAFFHTLGEVEPVPDTIVFFNTGVGLACKGSPVLDDLCTLEAEGIEMLVCGTCLGYFELKEELAVGQVSNMYDIAETMLRAGKVLQL
jgi:selenium metabolism protein YedF